MQTQRNPVFGCSALVLVLLFALGGAGCHKKRPLDDGPSCRQIVAYFARSQMFGAFDERNAIEECRAQKWTAKQRKCLMAAKDVAAMGNCAPMKNVRSAPQQKPNLPDWHPDPSAPLQGARDGSGSAAPVAPAPAPTAPAAPAPAAR